MIKIGETDFGNGHTKRDYNPISVRPRSLSVRPKRLGFVAGGYVNRTRWRQIDGFGEAEFDFWFGTYVDVRK